MRRPLLCLAVLAGASALAAPAHGQTLVATTAAASVTDAPPIQFVGTLLALSDDGNLVLGLTGLDPNKPNTRFDRAAGMSVNLPGAVVAMSGAGVVMTPTAVLAPDGSVRYALPSLPAGWSFDSKASLSDDGSVVLRAATNPFTLEASTFVSVEGSSTLVDLDTGVRGPTEPANLNHGAGGAAVSGNGRYVSFVHDNFVGGCVLYGTDSCIFDAYRRDLTDGSLVPVSLTASGARPNGDVARTAISDDGRFVAFLSNATNLVAGTTTAVTRLYRHDVVTGRTVLVAGPIDTSGPEVYSMSDDGTRFAYVALTGGQSEVRVADLAAGVDLPLVVQDTTNFPLCSRRPVLSGDGMTALATICNGPVLEPLGYTRTNDFLLATLRAPSDSVGYAGVTPSRLYDSRNGETDTQPNLAAGAVVTVAVGGKGGVPADATAAVLNVTVTNPAGAGFVTVWPCDTDRPTASNLNYTAGQTIPNAVVASLAPDGTVCLYTHNAADLIVDIAGSFDATSSYGSAAPQRVLDTRADENPTSPPSLAAGSVTTLDVARLADLPDSTGAVTLNVTVTKPLGAGFVTVYPCDAALPTASNLNYTAGQTIPNAVISQIAADGTVCLYTSNAADLIVDINGFFPAASGFTGLTPARLLDSRSGQTDTVPNLEAGSTTVVAVAGAGGVAANATTAVLNVTVTNPTAPGFVTVYPCDADLPTASNLNYVAGQTIPNLVVAKLSAQGTVCLYTKAPADLVVDVAGYLGGTAPSV